MVEMPNHFQRTVDELELALFEMPLEAQVALLIEVTARVLAQAEAFPDRRLLTILQQRTLAELAQKEDVPRGTIDETM